MTAPKDFNDRMLSLGLARVSEAAAHASARLIGRGDEKAADQAAVNAMREQLNLLDIKGVVVIGEGERDEAPMLYIGERVGARLAGGLHTSCRIDERRDPICTFASPDPHRTHCSWWGCSPRVVGKLRRQLHNT